MPNRKTVVKKWHFYDYFYQVHETCVLFLDFTFISVLLYLLFSFYTTLKVLSL